jgi:predicted nucleic acid-binding protein
LIVVDASVVIAALARADQHHKKAAAFFEGHLREKFVMHPLTLAETLVGGAKYGRLGEVEQKVAALGLTSVPPDADEPGLIAELRIATKLKLPDCCVLSLALQLTAPIATFDARLASAATSRAVGVVAIG